MYCKHGFDSHCSLFAYQNVCILDIHIVFGGMQSRNFKLMLHISKYFTWIFPHSRKPAVTKRRLHALFHCWQRWTVWRSGTWEWPGWSEGPRQGGQRLQSLLCFRWSPNHQDKCIRLWEGRQRWSFGTLCCKLNVLPCVVTSLWLPVIQVIHNFGETGYKLTAAGKP